MKRVMSGQPVRINRAHSDLWMRIQALFEDWSADQVQLIKVVSHCSLKEATSPLEEWLFGIMRWLIKQRLTSMKLGRLFFGTFGEG